MVSVFCLKVYEGYGQTECTAGCTFTTPGDWTSGRIGWRCGNELEQQALNFLMESIFTWAHRKQQKKQKKNNDGSFVCVVALWICFFLLHIFVFPTIFCIFLFLL